LIALGLVAAFAFTFFFAMSSSVCPNRYITGEPRGSWPRGESEDCTRERRDAVTFRVCRRTSPRNLQWEGNMSSTKIFVTAVALSSALLLSGQSHSQSAQAPAAAPQSGPGVQALRDSRYPAYLAANCKNAPAPAPAQPPRAAAPPPEHRDYKVMAIAGVIADGAKWKTIWTGTGNNADGPVATDDGGMLFAQNTDSKVMKLDVNGKASFPYSDTNTGGALAKSKNGSLYVLQRGLPQEIWQLEPKRQRVVSSFNGEPIDCAGGLLNDMTADSKGGIYFTKGGVYYADPKGGVTHYGTLAAGNGIILSPDEKTLYVTGRLPSTPTEPAAAGAPPAARPGGLVAFDVQPDGSLTNERQFALAGADGSAVDDQGRIYSTGGNGVQVIDKNGKLLGEIPSPLPLITVAFGGPNKKTLFGVANNQQHVEIFTIPMLASGYKGRAK
jgi:gluconolactonase